jgi:hypothetical protein
MKSIYFYPILFCALSFTFNISAQETSGTLNFREMPKENRRYLSASLISDYETGKCKISIQNKTDDTIDLESNTFSISKPQDLTWTISEIKPDANNRKSVNAKIFLPADITPYDPPESKVDQTIQLKSKKIMEEKFYVWDIYNWEELCKEIKKPHINEIILTKYIKGIVNETSFSSKITLSLNEKQVQRFMELHEEAKRKKKIPLHSK